METKAGTRARCAELFASEVDRRATLKHNIVEAAQKIRDTRVEVDRYKGEFSQRPLLNRIGAHILDFVRISPIIPRDLTRRAKGAQASYDDLVNQYQTTGEGIAYYGHNLPGEHNLLNMSYLAHVNKFALLYQIPVKTGDNVEFIVAEGSFDALHYKTVPKNRPATVRIPERDSLPPVLFIPRNHGATLAILGYDGPGSRDRFTAVAHWYPNPSSKTIPVDTRGFKIVERFPSD